MPSYPYEILFRLNRDGTIGGAHYKTIRVIQEDGEPDEEREGEAQPVAIGATKSGLDLAPILGTIAAAQQATLDRQATAIAAHAAELAAKDANIQQLLEDKARLQVVVDAFRVEVADPAPATEPGDTVTIIS